MLINKTLFSGKTTYTLCDEHEFNDFVYLFFYFFILSGIFHFVAKFAHP